jgi:single-stranded-DNA-specific exonuclease
MEVAHVNPATVDEEEIGFALAPRLNALSRVGQDISAEEGVELLITGDLTRARTIATALEALNVRRRFVTRQTMDAALQQLEQDRSLLDGPAIVIAGPTWDPGIVGLVAGRLAERFDKPAVVISAPSGEMARGSARSVKGVDIHAAIAAQSRLLHRSGGHPMAAGFSLPSERISAFRRGLWRTLAQMPAPAEREIQIAAYLSLDELSLDLVRAVEQIAPFGPGNERPIFATRDLNVASSAVVGRTREHRRVVVNDEAQQKEVVMWWQGADEPQPEGRFDLAYTLRSHAFAGETSVQLTWVGARARARTAIEVAPAPEVEVRDCRDLPDAASYLQRLMAEREGKVVVWGEATEPVQGARLLDRLALRQARTLVIWTIPPGPTVIRDALERVQPEVVVLFAIDPTIDTVRPFLERLLGLVKYVIAHQSGVVRSTRLAASMAHSESTVQSGLEWLAQQGHISLIDLGSGEFAVSDQGEPGSARSQALERLQEGLKQTAAYRSYYLRAAANRLLAVDR